MENSLNTVFKDEEVSHRILSILGDAKEYAVIVSPYITLWGHAKNAVQLAVQHRVKVMFLVRNDPNVVQSADMQWLVDNQVEVYALDRLHAKIYFNESNVITSSMNLTQSSSTDSFEIGTLVNDSGEAKEIRNYVTSRLFPLANPLGKQLQASAPPAKARKIPVNHSGEAKEIRNDVTSRLVNAGRRALGDKPSKPAPSRTKSESGFCIRCEERVSIDLAKPLCDKCYQIWARFGDEDYEEEVCHSCGKEADVSYAKPMCLTCYRRQAKGIGGNAGHRW